MTDAAFWLCLRPQPAVNDAERIVEAARLACLLDTAQRAHQAGFNPIIVHTTAPHLFDHAPDLPNLIVRRTNENAPIGAVVAAAAARNATGPVCYAGAGMPAMTADHWRSIREQIEAGQAVANSLHSADLLGVPQAAALTDLADEIVDNSFALRLRDESGLEIIPLERSAATLLDLDTPADLALLSLAEATATLEIGPRLSDVLAQSESPLAPARERLAAALDTLTEREQQLMVIGRVGAYVWSALDRDTAARIRIISEERGLRARTAAQDHGLPTRTTSKDPDPRTNTTSEERGLRARTAPKDHGLPTRTTPDERRTHNRVNLEERGPRARAAPEDPGLPTHTTSKDPDLRTNIISEERGLRARAAAQDHDLPTRTTSEKRRQPTRVASEDPGFRDRAASPTPPRSLLGLHADAVGPSALIDSLAELADAVIFDTRPLFAHLNWAASRADRFAADLGDPNAIANPQLRQFTKAAITAPIPIALGGHSLVSGGLLAAINIAWPRREQPQHTHPPA